MASNRRHQSGAVRFIPALKAVMLCTLIGGSCVGYVLQKNKIFDLGQQIGTRQMKLERLRKDNQDLANRLAALQRPTHLTQRVLDLKLDLARPSPHQMVWLTEYPPAGFPTNAAGLQYVRTEVGASPGPTRP
jgi:hypothetical protein